MNEQEQAVYDKMLSNIDNELDSESHDRLRALFEGMRLFTDSVAMRIQSDNLSKQLKNPSK